MPESEILTPAQAAQYLNVSLITVRRRLARRQPPRPARGRLWRIPKPALDDFLQGAPPAAAEPEGDDGLNAILDGARAFVAMMDEARTRPVWHQADLDWLFANLRRLDAEIRPALAAWDAAIGGE